MAFTNPLDLLFASFYDRFMAGAERAGLSAWRGELLGKLAGDVLEIGAGTGVNMQHYGPEAEVILLEPDASMRKKLEARAEGRPIHAGAAEALPFEDASFDVVVSGLVLCSVRDLPASIAEIHRVLRPDGRLVFIEHVASGTPWVRGLQHVVNPAWKIFGRGCNLNRDTESFIRSGGFAFEHIERARLPGESLPAIWGVAKRL